MNSIYGLVRYVGLYYHFIQIMHMYVYMFICMYERGNCYLGFFSKLIIDPNFKVSSLEAKIIDVAQISASSDFSKCVSVFSLD